jgi:hypothetical protein
MIKVTIVELFETPVAEQTKQKGFFVYEKKLKDKGSRLITDTMSFTDLDHC